MTGVSHVKALSQGVRGTATGECYCSMTREGLLEMVTHTLRPNDMEMPSRGNTGSAKA